jgi:hypothetical protein
LTLNAPDGSVFRQALVWDIDGDGADDALALVELPGPPVHDALYFYRGGAGGPVAPVAVALSPTVPFERGECACSRVERLTRVGRRSAAVELAQVCPASCAREGPDRVVALVRWSDGMKPSLVLPVVDPAGAPALGLDLDGADLDGDGLDDATLRVSLEGGEPPFEPGPPVQAVFRWFDRPAGMSREAGEPDRSLDAIATQAMQQAGRRKDAVAAIALATAGRFLWRAVCAESPTRRIAPLSETSPLRCEAGHALEDLGLSIVRAHVSNADAISAFAALDTAESAPATRTSARAAEAAGWLASLAPTVQATSMRAIGAVPRVGPAGTSWGALRFEPSGALLVRTLAGVVRVDPLHGDETDAPGVLAWGTKVASPDGKLRLSEVVSRCASLAVEARLEASDKGPVEGGADATVIPLPIPGPIAPRCGPGEREPVPVTPVAWGPAGLELIVAGAPVLIVPGATKGATLLQPMSQPVIPGAPRSPDGAVLVVPTTPGILVHGAKTRLYRAKELEHGYGELRDCTVSDDALRVACVRGGVAFVGIWPPP